MVSRFDEVGEVLVNNGGGQVLLQVREEQGMTGHNPYRQEDRDPSVKTGDGPSDRK